MRYGIEITEAAQGDFDNIYLYISKTLCNKQAAGRLIALLDKNIRSLADVPERYPLANDEYLRKIGVRFIVVKNYIIFYTVHTDKKRVYILRVLYGRRNWIDILQGDLKTE